LLALSLIALMLEARNTSEMSVNFYQTTRYNNPEDSHCHTRRRDNLKSHFIVDVCVSGVLLYFNNGRPETQSTDFAQAM
jgi:hypothetical protein